MSLQIALSGSKVGPQRVGLGKVTLWDYSFLLSLPVFLPLFWSQLPLAVSTQWQARDSPHCSTICWCHCPAPHGLRGPLAHGWMLRRSSVRLVQPLTPEAAQHLLMQHLPFPFHTKTLTSLHSVSARHTSTQGYFMGLSFAGESQHFGARPVTLSGSTYRGGTGTAVGRAHRLCLQAVHSYFCRGCFSAPVLTRPPDSLLTTFPFHLSPWKHLHDHQNIFSREG